MSFQGLLRQTISVKNQTGTKDLHAKDGFGSATDVRCRFEAVYKTITTAERERTPIHAIAAIPASATVERGAQVTYGSDVYRVLERSDVPGRNGAIHHYELMLQLWSYGS